jgi:hypothetical protein
MGSADGRDSTRKSEKAPSMNFGLVARMPTQRETTPAAAEHSSRQQPSSSVPAAAAGPTTKAGFVRTQAITINARTEVKGVIRLAPATVFGTPEDFPPLVVRGDTPLEPMETGDNDDSTHYSGNGDMNDYSGTA